MRFFHIWTNSIALKLTKIVRILTIEGGHEGGYTYTKAGRTRFIRLFHHPEGFVAEGHFDHLKLRKFYDAFISFHLFEKFIICGD